MKNYLIFDTELIGSERPLFLIRALELSTGKRHNFWYDKPAQFKRFRNMIANPKWTWVGFNSENFDRPLIAMALTGYDEGELKRVAQDIIQNELRSWQTYREYGIDFVEYDHIDLKEVPPGVMLSLKIYEGRMHSPVIRDMPFDHTHDLSDKERKIVEAYCDNDISETARLFDTVREQIELREQLGATYDLDLRSKSDAQCAEAILKKVCGIRNGDKVVPRFVRYTTPDFIKTDSPLLQELIMLLEEHRFLINHGNGSPEFPEFLTEPIKIGDGVYQMGIGGLHSQHDVKLHLQAHEKLLLSDFDVISYYPEIMMKAGLIPNLGGNRGELFLETYTNIYEQRVHAKRAGNKAMANTLKIVLNGTFGKLGSLFCSFYAPELMLAVTITGQLNLLCLIHELSKLPGVKVESANTDGILVSYTLSKRKRVLQVLQGNSQRTSFSYEETPYRRVAMKDVNNYFAVTDARASAIISPQGIDEFQAKGGKVKRKGLYAEAGVLQNKNPSMEICSDAVAAFLADGTVLPATILGCTDIRKFVEIRSVKGGGVQHLREIEVDDWQLVEDNGNASNVWQAIASGKRVKRKSRPKPYLLGVGGTPFGRVARWYMTKDKLPPITYVSSGNKVAGTEGGKLCLELPDSIPADLDYQWYADEAVKILSDIGVS